MTTDQRPPEIPLIYSRIVTFLLSLFGWRVTGQLPNLSKMVIIGAPHTSNWDFIVYFCLMVVLRARLNFIGKHTLFKPPLGGLMRWAGGIPINRSTTKNAVEQVVDAFNAADKLALVIAPEGTRSRATYWRTGFYYMALGAQVPIVLAFVDYPSRTCGIGPHFMPTGDIEKDFEIVRAFYADKTGRHPEKKGPIELQSKN